MIYLSNIKEIIEKISKLGIDLNNIIETLENENISDRHKLKLAKENIKSLMIGFK